MTAPADNLVATPEPAASRSWTPELPTLRGWLTHHSRNPLVLLVFLAALVFITWRLPKSPPDDSLTIRERAVAWKRLGAEGKVGTLILGMRQPEHLDAIAGILLG